MIFSVFSFALPVSLERGGLFDLKGKKQKNKTKIKPTTENR